MGWDYSKLASRSWRWPYETAGDYGTVSVELSPRGLLWSGDSDSAISSGYFSIAFQSFERFLEAGAPPAALAPAKEETSIREYIESQRVDGASTTLACWVVLDRWQRRKLRSLTVGLNGLSAFRVVDDAKGSLAPRRVFDVFAGTVPTGKQELAVYWETYSGRANKFHYFNEQGLSVGVNEGAAVRTCIHIDDQMAVRLEENPRTIAPAGISRVRIPMTTRSALRRILEATTQWSWAGDAQDHGSDEAARKLREDAVRNLEEAFLRAPRKLRAALPEVWAFVEVGESEEALYSFPDLRAKVERLLGKKS